MVSITSAALVAFAALANYTDAFSVSPLSSSALRQSSVRLLEKKDSEPLFFATDVVDKEEKKDSVIPADISRQREVLDEAGDALRSVGWAAPLASEEMTSADPFVQRINAQIQKESGVDLDELLNPAKVVNLERDLYNLRSELASLTGKEDEIDVLDLSTSDCDGGGGGERADEVRKKIDKKEKDLSIERRAVFRGWLKNIFLGQAILSLGLSWVMATNPEALFGSFDWFHRISSIDVSIQVLGFWWWWLFIVPSLRSRRPTGAEKKALDIAFLGTPLISILAPIATKDQGTIWLANLAVVAGSYAFAFLTFDENEKGDKNKDPEWLQFIYKSLDVGSGKERGARK
eukprot:CAMPEP_0197827048 /NCGR_PEP_ID=MMETSP1437-20131217/3924_1 /TAXON_ID=49252 ORGANISM="Eucampia antarctica, Strain CCMP1452" /NCGR_SAMPLE_ID=MMETSP1437 /ASSEMBLY_ACC=CAM_ASM_001096 /LENGTH=345 /DNA_ID=CAMNT_0043427761 /DNA_START=88 /DNA_END=1125 /DNA_ORIENTATION=-